MNTVHGQWKEKYPVALLLLACLMVIALTGTSALAAVFPITITANSSTKVYGTPITFVTAPPIPPAVAPLPDYTVTGALQPGDTVNSVTLTSAGTAAAAPLAGSPYSIVPSAAVMTITSGNTYTITYVNGSMTVTAAPPTVADPAYRKPILAPSSQTNAWTNLAPNALADYYTYVPFKNADAVALGFPITCGNPTAVGATAADLASTNDCYSISVKKFQQGLSLPAAWGFGGSGLINPATGTPFAASTWAYGYGSGGAGWVLPYYDTTKINPATGLPVVANTPVTGNAPAPFANGTLATAGIWHWPAPTIKGTRGRPVRVQWLNELPNEKPTGFDPTICGADPADCFPYNRIVTHVHGAHVGPESDGLVHAWFSPAFALKGPMFESTRKFGPEGTYYYPMDQEAGTIWYHDHSTGLTHNNTNMGMAGFFPITDASEKLLQTGNILPTGIRELGFALQDRVFYNDGQQAMPDAPILSPLFAATCTYLPPDPITGDILVTSAPSACSPVFMKALDGHLVPYPAVPGVPAPAAYLATSATLEFFGNIPVVNGVTYGKYNVDKGVYRMRFIGGTDSRAWALRLKVAGTGTDPVLNPARYIPFWQIGAEQGLLNNPAKQEHILIMPGERVDLLVDFSSAEALNDAGVSVGPLDLANKRIIVENWAGDVPYGGQLLLPANDPAAMAFRSANIPEVMAFDVSAVVVAGGAATPSAATALRPGVPAVPNLTVTPPPVATPVRTVSLVEITDIYSRIMPTIDGRGFLDYGVSELPKLNTTEVWDILNTTVDAHPMHLHQVAFQLINREAIATTCPTSLLPPLCVTPASTAFVPPYTSAVVTAYQPLSIELPQPHEIGYKDTIMCPPGKVTRVIATFDIPGVYVWHCHILSHEEHDMMRPMVVTTPATSVTLTASNMSQPAAGPITPVTLTAQAMTGIVAYPVGSGFEYNFTVAGPIHAPLPAPPQPTRTLPSFNSSLGDAFTVVNSASWTPPATPGVYTITASTKAMGAVGAGNPLVTATMNYTVSSGSVAINPASLTATYDGTLKSVPISTTPPGLTVNVTYNGSVTPPTNAGSYTVVATIVDPTNTYFGSASGTLLINRAPLTITAGDLVKPYGTLYTFTGSEFTATGLIGADTVISVTMTSTGASALAPVAALPYAVIATGATGTGLTNYAISFVNGTMTVTKATPVITWATPIAVTFGSTLTAAPFNATASVPGTFSYSPAPGLVLNSSSTPLSVTFTPTDAVNYSTTTATVYQATIPATASVAKISTGPAYPSIQAAYNAVLSGDVIKVLGTTLPNPLTINNPLITTITIAGGYDSTFAVIPGSFTTIQGKVTLQSGKTIMRNIIIK